MSSNCLLIAQVFALSWLLVAGLPDSVVDRILAAPAASPATINPDTIMAPKVKRAHSSMDPEPPRVLPDQEYRSDAVQTAGSSADWPEAIDRPDLSGMDAAYGYGGGAGGMDDGVFDNYGDGGGGGGGGGDGGGALVQNGYYPYQRILDEDLRRAIMHAQMDQQERQQPDEAPFEFIRDEHERDRKRRRRRSQPLHRAHRAKRNSGIRANSEVSPEEVLELLNIYIHGNRRGQLEAGKDGGWLTSSGDERPPTDYYQYNPELEGGLQWPPYDVNNNNNNNNNNDHNDDQASSPSSAGSVFGQRKRFLVRANRKRSNDDSRLKVARFLNNERTLKDVDSYPNYALISDLLRGQHQPHQANVPIYRRMSV